MSSEVSYISTSKHKEEYIEWGSVESPIGKPISKTSGFLISKDEIQETGYWQCTEGKWNCHVTDTEFCHFLEGECTYVSEDGQIIEVKPGTVAVFPKNWKGTCHIKSKIKKYYCIILKS